MYLQALTVCRQGVKQQQRGSNRSGVQQVCCQQRNVYHSSAAGCFCFYVLCTLPSPLFIGLAFSHWTASPTCLAVVLANKAVAGNIKQGGCHRVLSDSKHVHICVHCCTSDEGGVLGARHVQATAVSKQLFFNTAASTVCPTIPYTSSESMQLLEFV